MPIRASAKARPRPRSPVNQGYGRISRLPRRRDEQRRAARERARRRDRAGHGSVGGAAAGKRDARPSPRRERDTPSSPGCWPGIVATGRRHRRRRAGYSAAGGGAVPPSMRLGERPDKGPGYRLIGSVSTYVSSQQPSKSIMRTAALRISRADVERAPRSVLGRLSEVSGVAALEARIVKDIRVEWPRSDLRSPDGSSPFRRPGNRG